MRAKLHSLKEFIKRRKKLAIISSIILVIILLIGWRVIANRNNVVGFEYYTVSKGSVVQEVDVTGKVKPAEAIDFAFETSGKVSKVNVKVGDKVKSGATLASIKNNDVSASVAQAAAGVDAARSMIAQYQAQLDAQNAKLTELRNGARPEDIQATQIKIDSANRSVADAQTNLDNTKTKADSDLSQTYSDCANSAVTAVSIGLNALSTITDIQYAHFNSNDQEASTLAGAKANAVYALVGGTDAGRWMFQFINSMYGGARGSATTAQANPTEVNVLKALSDTASALGKIQITLDSIPYNSSVLTASEKSNITLERANINGQISALSSKTGSISAQKNLNNNLIQSAQSQLNQAQNNLDSANQEMVIKRAGATAEQIQAQEAAVHQIEANIATQNAQIRSAQASLAASSAQLGKTVLTSSIDGTVTRVDVRAGEMASPSKPVVSVMTDAKFKIEANVPEADIAKIKVEDTARVTLDAYGSDVSFDAKVVKIDPAETVIDGVSTYNVTFEFINDDEKIKSGMTANTTVLTAKKDDILNIPQRSLIKKDGKNFVLISSDGKTTKEIEVEIGLIGSDGNVEVVGGLKEGDKIVNPSSVKK